MCADLHVSTDACLASVRLKTRVKSAQTLQQLQVVTATVLPRHFRGHVLTALCFHRVCSLVKCLSLEVK